ncbi:MAG: type II toxin-antitoxin system VapC family toxin [Nocardioidaceae bacterium]
MTTLLDTGPVVAAIDRSDAHHVRCAELLDSLSGKRLIPITVVVEVCWLLEERPDIEAAFLDSIAAGQFELVTITRTDLTRMAELVRTYDDFPLGGVDASVFAVAERLKVTRVATLDRRHSPAVRPSHCSALTLLP